ncbi:MAG: SRPBCC family protein [Rubrivivax sp.]
MEVKLDKRYPIEASVEQAWAVLSDVRATAACMPGAQLTDQVDDTHYKGVVNGRVGPAVMTFNGNIEVLGLDAATRSLQMLGKGADKAGSSASMNLSAQVLQGETAGTSVLTGQATIIVSGKLSQFGSRLLVPVSDMMLGQFADNFRAAAAAVAPVATAAPGTAAASDHGAAAADFAAAVGAAPAGAFGGMPRGTAPATSAAELARSPAPAPRAAAPMRPANELNALGLVWGLFKRWVAGLFGRKTDTR